MISGLNNIIDQVYLINRKEDKIRLRKSSLELASGNINFTKVVPIDPDCLHFQHSEIAGWNERAYSLLRTTQTIIMDAQSKQFRSIMIMEDDIKIDLVKLFQFSKKFEIFANSNPYWDFIHLNYSDVYKSSFTEYDGFLRLVSGCLCCQAYILNNQVYDIYLEYLDSASMPIDCYTRLIHKHRKMSFIPTIKPISHIPNEYSTIRDGIVGY